MLVKENIKGIESEREEKHKQKYDSVEKRIKKKMIQKEAGRKW